MKKGDYIYSPAMDAVAKVLSGRLKNDERKAIIITDTGIDADFYAEYFFVNARPIEKKEFEAAFKRTVKFLKEQK